MANPTPAVPAPQPGMFESLKDKLSPSALMEKLNLNSGTLLESALYLAVGFLFGYLLKKYGTFFFCAVLFIVFLVLAQQLGLISITVYWQNIQSFFGVQGPEPVEGSLLTAYWVWIKAHLLQVVCFSGGFLFGLRLG